jgi:hypothetical protein
MRCSLRVLDVSFSHGVPNLKLVLIFKSVCQNFRISNFFNFQILQILKVRTNLCTEK